MRLIGLAVVFAVSLILRRSPPRPQQAAKVARIGGFLQPAPIHALDCAEAFRQGLRDHGYVEGQNVVIEYRVSRGSRRFPALLAELVALKIDVIVHLATPAQWRPRRPGARSRSSAFAATRCRQALSPVWRGPAAMSRGRPSSPELVGRICSC